jgi:hypothetical protein
LIGYGFGLEQGLGFTRDLEVVIIHSLFTGGLL